MKNVPEGRDEWAKPHSFAEMVRAGMTVFRVAGWAGQIQRRARAVKPEKKDGDSRAGTADTRLAAAARLGKPARIKLDLRLRDSASPVKGVDNTGLAIDV